MSPLIIHLTIYGKMIIIVHYIKWLVLPSSALGKLEILHTK